MTLKSAKRLTRCIDCGASIAHRYHNARSCEPCHEFRVKASREKYKRGHSDRVVAAGRAWWARQKADRSPRCCVGCAIVLTRLVVLVERRPGAAPVIARVKYCDACASEKKKRDRREGARRSGWADAHKRRARKAGASGAGVTLREWSKQVEIFGGRCAYCLKPAKLAQDHVEPISTGGADEIGNVVPARKSCNSIKHDRRIWSMLKIG